MKHDLNIFTKRKIKNVHFALLYYIITLNYMRTLNLTTTATTAGLSTANTNI